MHSCSSSIFKKSNICTVPLHFVKHVKYLIPPPHSLDIVHLNRKFQFKNNSFSMFQSKFFIIVQTIFLVLKNDS